MKQYFIVLLSLVFLSFSGLVAGQSFTVSGKLIDEKTGDPLVGARVEAKSETPPTSLQKASDPQGKFSFSLSNGSYDLIINYIGFEEKKMSITVNGEDMLLGDVALAPSTTYLENAQVESTATRAEQIGDTTQFNADAYKVNQDATADKLLEKIPGMRMKDGRMESQGEQVQQVLVDGKPFFGDDPNAAIKNIPAKMIDKVQVYDQKSEQAQFTGFDDGETKKTVNIVTKPEYRQGTFGRVQAGAGDDGEYRVSGTINKFKNDTRLSLVGQANNINEQNFSSEDLSGVASANVSGNTGGRRWRRNSGGADVGDFLVSEQGGITETQALGFNYTDEYNDKTELTMSYFLNKTTNGNTTDLFRQFILPGDSGQVYNEVNRTSTDNINHRFNLRVKHKFNENNELVFQPSFSMQTNEGFQDLDGRTLYGTELLNSTRTNLSTELEGFNVDNNLNFRHKFGKEGRTISLNLRNRYTSNTGSKSLYALNTFEDLAADTLDQQANLDKLDQYHRFDITYTESIGENMQLMLSYRPSVSLGDVDQKTYAYFSEEENYSILDSLQSNTFNSQYITHEGGPGLRWSKGRDANISVRANYQYATLTSDQEFPTPYKLERNFEAILPMVHARFRLKNKASFFMFYRRDTDAPSVGQLQEVIDNSNPLSLSTGNAALDQSRDHRVFGRYSSSNTEKGTVFSAYMRASFTNAYITNATYIGSNEVQNVIGIDLAPGTRLSIPVNLNGQYSYRGGLEYGLPLKKLGSNLNLELNGSYNRTPGIINNELNIAYSPQVGVGASLSSGFSEKFDFTLSGRPSWNYVQNSLTPENDSRYFSMNSSLRLYWNFYKTFVFRSEVTNQFYSGLSEDFNQDFTLMNASIGYKFLKNDQLEANISVFDALEQNNSISRTVSETTIDDVQTIVLQRYFMFNLIWTINSFGTVSNIDDRGFGGPGHRH